MPKETIRRLSEDVGRLLVAGAHLAAGDPELAKDRAALEKLAKQFGDKAPVLGQLGALVKAAADAPAKDAARELMTLATSVAQVRAAQAALAPADGPAEPLPAAESPGTPCNARELYELHEALVVSGAGRMEKVEAAVKRGDIADLRLVDAVVQAVGDSYVGEYLTRSAAPLIGRALIPPLRRRFRPKGGTVDGRRLKILIGLEKTGAMDLILTAVKEGTPAVREAVLDAVADHMPGAAELEPIVLDLIAKERAGAVRTAAVRALAGYGSDAALEALIKALAEPGSARAAAEALGKSKHPKVVARLTAALDAALAEVDAAKKAKKKDAKEAKAAVKKKASSADPVAEARASVDAVLTALAPHGDKAVATKSLELIERCGRPAAEAVVAGGDKAQLAAVADLLAGTEEELFAPAVAAAVKLGPADAYTRMTAAFAAKDIKKSAGEARMSAVLEGLDSAADARWPGFLLKAAAEGGRIAELVIPVIGELGNMAVVPQLTQMLGEKKLAAVRSAVIDALGKLADASAIDPILAVVADAPSSFRNYKDYWVLYSVRGAVLQIGHVSAVNKVRDVLAKMPSDDNDYRKQILNGLLRDLVDRFPGH